MNVLEKVTAFITRGSGPDTELLLFRHPNAGVQIPAGTVEPGEAHPDAAVREAMEETGLDHLSVKTCIGSQDTNLPESEFVIFRKTKVYARPSEESFDWAEFKRGLPVVSHRENSGFTQVTYTEHDRFPDPTYVTYGITGWVPTDILAQSLRRYFYHMICEGDSPDTWVQHNDWHRFEPFWALLANLPAIIGPQRKWLDYVTSDLRYDLR